MNLRSLHCVALSVVVLSTLAACSDGKDGATGPAGPSGVAPTPTQAELISQFTTNYTAGLTALTSFSGLTNPDFSDLFDVSYLHTGHTKSQVSAALAQEADALARSVGQPEAGFPAITVSDIAVTDCVTATGICKLTANLTNKDVDTTTVSFTTQVRYTGGKLRFYGDQKAEAL